MRPPRDCRIEYCLFVQRPAQAVRGRPRGHPAELRRKLHRRHRRDVRDRLDDPRQRFRRHPRPTREARGAVFLWHDSRDCVVERNVIVELRLRDLPRQFAQAGGRRGPLPDHVVRNNFVCRGPENGILADHTRDCAILHNTVHDPRSRLGRLIRIVHDNDGLVVTTTCSAAPPPRQRVREPDSLLRNNLSGGELTGVIRCCRRGEPAAHGRSDVAIDRAKRLSG